MNKSEKEIIYGKILYQLKKNPSAGATSLYEIMKSDYPFSVVYYHYNEIKKIMHAVYNADKRNIPQIQNVTVTAKKSKKQTETNVEKRIEQTNTTVFTEAIDKDIINIQPESIPEKRNVSPLFLFQEAKNKELDKIKEHERELEEKKEIDRKNDFLLLEKYYEEAVDEKKDDYYRTSINEEIKMVAQDSRRVPLLPNDMRNPYRQELWYKREDLPDDKQGEYNSNEYVRRVSYYESQHRHKFYEKVNIYGETVRPNGLDSMYILREAKKGTGTRGYITQKVEDLKYNIMKNNFNVDSNTLDYEIDSVIMEWEYPKENAKTRVYDGGLSIYKHPVMKRATKEEEEAMEKVELRKYLSTLNLQLFRDEIITEQEAGELLRRVYGEDKYRLYLSNVMSTKITNEEKMYGEEEGKSETANRMNGNEIVWLVEYNNSIIASKLNYIFKEMSKKYEINLIKEDFLTIY